MIKEAMNNPWIKVSITIVAIVVIFLIGIKISDILCSLMIAFIIAYIFSPIIDALEKIKISRAGGVILTLCLLFLITFCVILYIMPRTISELTYLANKLPEFQSYTTTLFDKIETIKISPEALSIFNVLTEKTKDGLSGIAQSVPTMGIKILKRLFLNIASLFSYLLNIIIFGVVTIYLLKDFNKIKEWILTVTPYKYKNSLINISTKIDSNLRAFFRGQLLVCLILAAIYTSGLVILGVNSALLIGLIGGFSNLIPYFGLFMGMIPAMILSLIEFQNIFHILGVAGIFLIGQFIEGVLISPRVVGEKIGLNPILIIMSIMVFGRLLGVFGVIFAVPLLSILKVVVEMLINNSPPSPDKEAERRRPYGGVRQYDRARIINKRGGKPPYRRR